MSDMSEPVDPASHPLAPLVEGLRAGPLAFDVGAAPKPCEKVPGGVLYARTVAHDDSAQDKARYDVAAQIAQLEKDIEPGTMLLALRCPCGFMIGMGVPVGHFVTTAARDLALQVSTNFFNSYADHIENLADRLARFAAIPVAKRREGFPTPAQIVEGYHNNPCMLRPRQATRSAEPAPVTQPFAPAIKVPAEALPQPPTEVNG